ncbi:hypothetical protein BDB01DRAFT_836637 [Pilobolus umbonatus]|nr:hypothetical protein BDB01DRAFT_836637 [Pilobolus umbonatus]
MNIQGFWGLELIPGKTYTQEVTTPFRVAMAALSDELKSESRSSVHVSVNGNNYVLCTLIPNKIEQQLLDIVFAEGEEVVFSTSGENVIHLTGNYTFNDEEDSDYNEELLQQYMNGEMGSDDEEIDSDEVGEDSDEELEEVSDEEEEEEEEEKVVTKPSKKRAAESVVEPQTKKQKATKEEPKKEPKKEVKKEEPKKEVKKEEPKKKEAKKDVKKEEPKKEEPKKKEAKKEEPKKEESKKKEDKKEEPKAAPKITKLPNGLVTEDVKVGSGASCKSGQRIGMRYIGKLASNGKVFDKNVSGKPFVFNLGRSEVIKGWDIGIVGMKVGGERKLMIPAALAYGKRGAPPDIPKNANLVFDVKLVSIK